MDEVEMQVALAKLTQSVESNFREFGRRMDDQQAMARQQHADNVVRLDRIEVEVRRTNGRVTELEKIDVARSAGNAATARAEDRARTGSPVVTWETAQQFAKFGGWVVAGVMGVLHLMGKL